MAAHNRVRAVRRIGFLALAVLIPVASMAQESVDQSAYFASANWLVRKYFGRGDYQALEAFIEQISTSRVRDDGGMQETNNATKAVQDAWERSSVEQDAEVEERLKAWKEERPGSDLEPVFEAIYYNLKAWRARGHGYASSVTPEGWQLFRERMALAWTTLQVAEKKSSRYPMFYQMAIFTGQDAGASASELRRLFESGVQKFPDEYGLYFAAMRPFVPRWGGSYEAADEFIRRQTAAKSPGAEELYTRLYWNLDNWEQNPHDFFAISRVDWPRMRRGFQAILTAYPKHARNRATFAGFACRANDRDTYLALRPQVTENDMASLGIEGLSREICDARFGEKRPTLISQAQRPAAYSASRAQRVDGFATRMP